jgi:hypothetical protein
LTPRYLDAVGDQGDGDGAVNGPNGGSLSEDLLMADGGMRRGDGDGQRRFGGKSDVRDDIVRDKADDDDDDDDGDDDDDQDGLDGDDVNGGGGFKDGRDDEALLGDVEAFAKNALKEKSMPVGGEQDDDDEYDWDDDDDDDGDE